MTERRAMKHTDEHNRLHQAATLALRVPCWYCGAGVGEPCVARSDQPQHDLRRGDITHNPHSHRLSEASRVRRGLPDPRMRPSYV